MTFGTFERSERITTDKVRIDTLDGHNLLVRVQDFRAEFKSTAYPTPKPVVFVDVADLSTGQVYIGALWGAAAVVDGLKPYAGTGQVLPVSVEAVAGGAHGKWMRLNPLEGDALTVAGQWYESYWAQHVDAVRAQREAEAKVEAVPAPTAPAANPAPALAPVQATAPATPAAAPPVAAAPAQAAAPPVTTPPAQMADISPEALQAAIAALSARPPATA